MTFVFIIFYLNFFLNQGIMKPKADLELLA